MTQDDALSILKLGVNVFLTGEPGAGKTHTINQYIEWLRERGVEPSVTASTGIAATHVNGMTIHSWSGIGIKKDINQYDIENIQSREKTYRRIVEAKVLIIDEISMLDARTLESIDRVLRALRRRPLMEEQPFGGFQVIFVGDFFQLPPVSRSEAAHFAFQSEAWKAANPVVCYLSEQHRQEDGEFLDLLGAVRRNKVQERHREVLRGRMHGEGKVKATRLHTHNAEADRINDESLAKVEGKTHVFHMTTRGASSLVESLKQNCLSPETLVLKEGASVMFTRNNFDEGYVNGTLGKVAGFASNGNPIVKTKNGSIEAKEGEWSIADGSKILAQIKQIPLRLAWAITIHKSQGMSLDAAIIDLSQAFEYGQGYVALSRVRTLEGLFLEGFNDQALLLHPTIQQQDALFRAKSDAAQKRISTIPNGEREGMEKNFLRAIGAHEPEPVKKKEFATKSGKLTAVREKFPNAGRPWTKVDDARLTEMFEGDAPMKKMTQEFGRKSGAINARLAKLGLIENVWAQRRGDDV
jgi:ATP-dependent exoDNAse (exonuclease V) alpha subunit